ncbi:MAG: hypothetical protein IID44_00175 [Planctomycetes bacterium]|nr:hypothetical protein [Planctomycetota bacterium]
MSQRVTPRNFTPTMTINSAGSEINLPFWQPICQGRRRGKPAAYDIDRA